MIEILIKLLGNLKEIDLQELRKFKEFVYQDSENSSWLVWKSWND